jgi:hypothetical protein
MVDIIEYIWQEFRNNNTHATTTTTKRVNCDSAILAETKIIIE